MCADGAAVVVLVVVCPAVVVVGLMEGLTAGGVFLNADCGPMNSDGGPVVGGGVVCVCVDGMWPCIGELWLCCCVGACSNWPRGMRHTTSTFGARVGALNAGMPSLELLDSSSAV